MIKYNNFQQQNLVLKTVYILFFFIISKAYTQEVSFHSPLDIPLIISGNFGELRTNHFHAGIDIKTNGSIGQRLYSLDDGYVSRIKVESGGYGNAIYISHPNGYTSVYAHLNNFIPKIQEYVREQQYLKRSFEIDLYLEKNFFRVEKGQLIGFTGNTGRSGGPHLHLEVRKTTNQIPQNVLKFNFPIDDTIAPKFRKLALYEFSDAYTLETTRKVFYPTTSVGTGTYIIEKPLKVSGTFAFGTEAYDYVNESPNRCGVYELILLLDNKHHFSFRIDQVGFHETRYINSHMDYQERMLNKRNVHRLYREPGNNLKIYDITASNGLIGNLTEGKHKIQLIAKDIYGNQSVLNFEIDYTNDSIQTDLSTDKQIFQHTVRNSYKNDLFRISFEPHGFYRPMVFRYSRMPLDSMYYSDFHIAGDEFFPLHKYAQLSIKPNRDISGIDPEKLLICSINHKAELIAEGGTWNIDHITTHVRNLGRFVVAIDTVPPEIKRLQFNSGKKYGAKEKIRFKIEDNLSGIKTYNGYINDKWVLFTYDAKSGIVEYEIDPTRLEKNKKQILKLYIMDERNNMAVFEGEFYY